MRACFFFLFTVFCFTSCVKEVFPDLGPVDPKLVLNTRFSPDKPWAIHISSNARITSSLLDLPDIENAVVEIIDETSGDIILLQHEENGYYRSVTATPVADHNYSISVKAAGYPDARASSYVPGGITVTVSDTSTGIFLNSFVYDIDLQINDRGAEENFYLVEAYNVTGNAPSFQYSLLSQYALDANTENGELGPLDQAFDRVYLPDRNFNGQNYPLSLKVRSVFSPFSGNVRLQLRVLSASRELYDYLKSYEAGNQVNLDIEYTEQSPVITNIEGGLGIFGGYSQAVFNFEF